MGKFSVREKSLIGFASSLCAVWVSLISSVSVIDYAPSVRPFFRNPPAVGLFTEVVLCLIPMVLLGERATEALLGNMRRSFIVEALKYLSYALPFAIWGILNVLAIAVCVEHFYAYSNPFDLLPAFGARLAAYVVWSYILYRFAADGHRQHQADRLAHPHSHYGCCSQ